MGDSIMMSLIIGRSSTVTQGFHAREAGPLCDPDVPMGDTGTILSRHTRRPQAGFTAALRVSASTPATFCGIAKAGFNSKHGFQNMEVLAEWSRRTYPAPSGLGAGGVGSIPANSDALNVPSFRRWLFGMKLSPFFFKTWQFKTWQGKGQCTGFEMNIWERTKLVYCTYR
jgi:hypothetical protein